MKENYKQAELRLLPRYFNKIGVAIFLIIGLIIVLTVLDVFKIDPDILLTITKSGILVGLLILAMTKIKTEDELTLRIRLKSLGFAFIFGVGYTIIEPFINLLFQNSFITKRSVSELLITMLLVYFVIFHSMLKKR